MIDIRVIVVGDLVRAKSIGIPGDRHITHIPYTPKDSVYLYEETDTIEERLDFIEYVRKELNKINSDSEENTLYIICISWVHFGIAMKVLDIAETLDKDKFLALSSIHGTKCEAILNLPETFDTVRDAVIAAKYILKIVK